MGHRRLLPILTPPGVIRRPPAEPIYVGRAGWTLARAEQPNFPSEGSHLSRYAQRLPAVEINSSFYRPHRRATYVRWAASVPERFRFAVKMPRTITHTHRLLHVDALLDGFFEQIIGLGRHLGCILVQLPPSLTFDPGIAIAFFASLRARFDGDVAFEPRHASWFSRDAEQLLTDRHIARVAADPPRVDTTPRPGAWSDLIYFRLHGSPIVYHSAYDDAYLAGLAETLTTSHTRGSSVWCIFDNTARGAATENALALSRRLGIDPTIG
ncbi:MAG TPA: DUF72 domain-containing protein [Gemmatimonadaceae bacterium]|nr:DUF72 domain-containing protein [Gemmatimonadaceae bacterium]